MENEQAKLLWLEYQLTQSTEESLIEEAQQLEAEMKMENIVMPDAPEGFFCRILERGKELERNQLIEKWCDECGTFEDICPTCGGKLKVVARRTNSSGKSSLKIRCEHCKTQWV